MENTTEKFIRTITEGVLWGVIITCMLSVIILVAAGTYRLIEQPSIYDLLLFAGAGCSLFLKLMATTEN